MVGFALTGVSERDERHFRERGEDFPRLLFLNQNLTSWTASDETTAVQRNTHKVEREKTCSARFEPFVRRGVQADGSPVVAWILQASDTASGVERRGNVETHTEDGVKQRSKVVNLTDVQGTMVVGEFAIRQHVVYGKQREGNSRRIRMMILAVQ